MRIPGHNLFAFLVATLLLLAGCAVPRSQEPQLGQNEVPPEMLLTASPLDNGDASPHADTILELTPDMVAFLDENAGDVGNRYARLKRLLDAIMGGDEFKLIYDEGTRTAAETFRDRRGNCLSFTNMFVAMARYLDIVTEYQEVDIPPAWSLAGDSFLFSQHVNAHVDLGGGETRAVDFNIYEFNAAYERRVISDARARAHYYNNIGAERMLAGDNAGAYANFRRGIREDGAFAPAWINLGILHRRAELPAWAEAAYLQALRIEPFNLVGMSNLANLYEEAGMTELAEVYRQRVESHRMKNPYYRYNLAQAAVVDGDYDAAIDHLQYAIRQREDEDRFYFLLSVAYLMQGDRPAAERWMSKAEELAGEQERGQKYHNKLEWLLSRGQPPREDGG